MWRNFVILQLQLLEYWIFYFLKQLQVAKQDKRVNEISG